MHVLHSQSPSQPVDIYNALLCLSVDIIGRFGFSYDLNAVKTFGNGGATPAFLQAGTWTCAVAAHFSNLNRRASLLPATHNMGVSTLPWGLRAMHSYVFLGAACTKEMQNREDLIHPCDNPSCNGLTVSLHDCMENFVSE